MPVTSSPLAAPDHQNETFADNVIRLDGALVQAEAALEAGDIPLPPRFPYQWRGLPITGFVYCKEHTVLLRQCPTLGQLPYSAEDPAKRARLIAFLDKIGALAEGRCALTRQQGIAFVTETEVEAPANGLRLAVACVHGALAAIPHIESLRA